MSERQVFVLITHDSSLITSPELLQKPHVILEQQSDIIELINPCAGAINPESESETGEFLGIDVRGAQHVRVHHA